MDQWTEEYNKFKKIEWNRLRLESNKRNDQLLEQEFLNIKKSFADFSLSNKRPFLQNLTHRNGQLFCKEVSEELVGPLNVTERLPANFWAASNYHLTFGEHVTWGGSFNPRGCEARHKVAVVVPFKNRLANLNYFLYHLHPFLQRQQLNYRIFVVEQFNDELFNKGVLNNACFLEIFKLYNLTVDLNDLSEYPFDCVIFHDVDLLPEG